jgi:hypothetical protein
MGDSRTRGPASGSCRATVAQKQRGDGVELNSSAVAT